MLIATKLHPPSPRPQQVVRQHLLTRLQAALTYPLTLLSAPAGFGKTTLMADFRWRIITGTIAVPGTLPVEEAARVARPQFGWLSLDEGDNDPIRFWTYVAMTLETVWPGIGQPVVDALQAVATQSHPLSTSLEALLTLLINRLAQREEHLVLVLDDYHAIHTVLIHDTLQFFLEHQPNNLHLILLTRSDPPLSLARWRVRGQLLELRTADLRFTLEETDAFFQQTMQLALAPPQVAQLEAHTEGWIAGLQLAALSLQGRSECADLINSFTGSHRFVLDYLVDEVLQQQPTDVQRFLLQTSILDRFCAPLCDALMGDEGLATKNSVPLLMASLPSQEVLNRLDRANLFLIPLDEAREWWRYHHLFADVLRCRLQETQPAIVPELHRRAAGWFAQHNLLPEAIHHALAAADFALAAELIEQNADTLLKRGEHHTLRSWLARLPISVLDARPQLLLIHARILAFLHQLERAERDLDAAELSVQCAEPALRPWILGQVAALRAQIASLHDDLPQAISLGQQALAMLPPEDVHLRGEAMLRLGGAYGWQGQVVEATQAFTEAKRLGVEAHDLHTTLLAMLNLGAMQSMQGHRLQALAIQRAALAWAAEQGVPQIPVLSAVHVELGRLLYEGNELEQAAEHLEAAIRSSERGGLLRTHTDAYIVLSIVRQAQGSFAAAQDAMCQAEQLIEHYRLPLRYRSLAMQARLLLSLARGDLTAATEWADNSGLTVTDELDYAHEEERIALAHLLVAQGHYGEAITFLTRLYQFAEAQGRVNQVIKILALKAKAFSLLGDQSQALATLRHALALAVPGGYVRSFVGHGDVMKTLLVAFSAWILPQPPNKQHTPLLAYVDQLLAAFGLLPALEDEKSTTAQVTSQNPKSRPPSEPQNSSDLLSARELEVLQLLAVGTSNSEIGETLFVSLNTVKRHVRNIFNKLGVNNRTQAVARARELSLL